MFTLTDALGLEALSQARVVAGSQGLGREVRWAQVVDVPDITQWVREGDLLLTTAYTLLKNAHGQESLILDLHTKGLAGLVLACGGDYFKQAPEIMRAQGNHLGFPIIESPWDVPFHDIVMALAEEIISAQNRWLRRASEIHDRFTARVLQGGGPAELAADLATVLARSVLIADASFAVIANASFAEPSLFGEQASDILPDPLVTYIRESRPPGADCAWRLAANHEKGAHADCVIAPIAVGRQTLGYVLAGATGDSLGDLDLRAAESTAAVTALLLFKERAVHEAESRMEGSLMDRLLAGNAPDDAMVQAAQRYGIDATRTYAVAFMEIGEHNTPALQRTLRNHLAQLRQPLLIGERDSGVLLLLSGRRQEVKAAAERLIRMLGMPHPLRVGIGTCVRLSDLQSSYQQAREALTVALRLKTTVQVICFDDLGLLHWLWALPTAVRDANIYSSTIRKLADQDRARGTDLLTTLEAYVLHGGAIHKAAAALHVHRHTLKYRLDKIARVCELNVEAPLVRLNMQVALIEYRLRGEV